MCFEAIYRQKLSGDGWGSTKMCYAGIFCSIIGLWFKIVKIPFPHKCARPTPAGSREPIPSTVGSQC